MVSVDSVQTGRVVTRTDTASQTACAATADSPRVRTCVQASSTAPVSQPAATQRTQHGCIRLPALLSLPPALLPTVLIQDCTCRSLTSPLPDLVVKVSDLLAELSVASFNFTARSCSMIEKCVVAPGQRRILRFSVSVLNQGRADVVLPDPTLHPLNFQFSPCHQHYHYNHFAEYSLIRNNSVQLVGHKQVDLTSNTPSHRTHRRFWLLLTVPGVFAVLNCLTRAGFLPRGHRQLIDTWTAQLTAHRTIAPWPLMAARALCVLYGAAGHEAGASRRWNSLPTALQLHVTRHTARVERLLRQSTHTRAQADLCTAPQDQLMCTRRLLLRCAFGLQGSDLDCQWIDVRTHGTHSTRTPHSPALVRSHPTEPCDISAHPHIHGAAAR